MTHYGLTLSPMDIQTEKLATWNASWLRIESRGVRTFILFKAMIKFSVAKSDCTTFVRSKQSMQFVLKRGRYSMSRKPGMTKNPLANPRILQTWIHHFVSNEGYAHFRKSRKSHGRSDMAEVYLWVSQGWYAKQQRILWYLIRAVIY